MNIVEFYKRNSIFVKISTIRTIVGVPFLLLHELWHLILVALTSSSIEFTSTKILVIEDNILYNEFDWEVTTSSDFKMILVSLAPLLSFIILPIINIYFIFILIVFFDELFISEQDYQTFKENI